jgi:hypothetical protein
VQTMRRDLSGLISLTETPRPAVAKTTCCGAILVDVRWLEEWKLAKRVRKIRQLRLPAREKSPDMIVR